MLCCKAKLVKGMKLNFFYKEPSAAVKGSCLYSVSLKGKL